MRFNNPCVTADIIVPYKGGIVLIKRREEPFKGCWALPGGHLEYGKENAKQAAIRELKEETGLEGKIEDLLLYDESSDPGRDPRGHYVTLVYVLQNAKGKLKARSDASDIKVCKKLPKKMAFDHKKILEPYMKPIDIRDGYL